MFEDTLFGILSKIRECQFKKVGHIRSLESMEVPAKYEKVGVRFEHSFGFCSTIPNGLSLMMLVPFEDFNIIWSCSNWIGLMRSFSSQSNCICVIGFDFISVGCSKNFLVHLCRFTSNLFRITNAHIAVFQDKILLTHLTSFSLKALSLSCLCTVYAWLLSSSILAILPALSLAK